MDSAEELARAVKEATAERDGRLTLACRDAFRLAESHGVPPARIGQVCNDNSIKIVGCQLGCFR